MKKAFFLLITLCLFTACGRGQNEEADYNYENGYIFTISTSSGMPLIWVTEAAENLENRLASEGIYVRFIVESYIPDERDEHLERKLGRFAAGMGPDIFVRDGFLLRPFTEHGFIRDIHPLIEASENLSLDDFFENALRAHEIGGRLYTMPMTFGFDFVGINSRVPRAFRDRFLALSHVSIPELAALYNDIITSDPRLGELAFMNFGLGITRFVPYIDCAVDFAEQRIAFPGGTTDVLYAFRNAFENNDRFGNELIFTHNEENLQMLQERYIFFSPIGTSAGAESLFDFQTTFFMGFIPISNLEGELIDTNMVGAELVVSSSAQEWLATAFIEEMLSVTGNSFDFNVNSHIMRRYARQYLVYGLERAMTQFTLRPIVDTRTNAVAGAAARIIGFGDLPITRPIANRYLPPQTFMPALNSFMRGEIAAAEAVSQMEAGIAEFFDAEIEEIAPYVPAPVFVQDGPTRTLRVMTTSDHTGVLEQAARLLNESWQAQGISYLFVLEVDDWNPHDWESHETRASRLAVELMAGGGPDMFLLLPHHMDIRSMAERGFLADINALIENHPASRRSDFYEHILDALEINGGLYIFPVSFAFHRAGVNTAIPQPFVDRFMAYESVSATGLLDFYLDFVEMHGHEYGHLCRGFPLFMLWRESFVRSNMVSFIDFDRRTSNLNSTQFADFLASFKRVYERHDSAVTFTWSTISSDSSLRQRQQEYLFEANTNRGMAVEAFMSRPQPFFTNYIPITDDFGNLIFDITNINTWATWAITTVGDSALAWEFLTYVLEAYYAPTGRAAVTHLGVGAALWTECIATPIKRSHFETRTRRILEHMTTVFRGVGFKHAPGTPEWGQEIEDAIRTIAAQNEMPVVHINPMFPPVVMGFLEEPLEQFLLGLITAETAALRIHNAIAIWLLE